jgi:hypothetical protein
MVVVLVVIARTPAAAEAAAAGIEWGCGANISQHCNQRFLMPD